MAINKDSIKIIKEIYLTKEEAEQFQSDEEFIEAFKEKMLNCDLDRAGLPRLSDEKLTGINSGHWDLWDYNELREKDCIKKIALPEGQYFFARNPYKDMQDNEGKTLAIDFGTKSTVVGYLDREKFVPIEVSNMIGYIDDNSILDRYENLSVMHFVDFKKFMEDYAKKAGRPNTKWSDFQAFRPAQNAINFENFDSFLNDLKSWCFSGKKHIIKDETGKNYEFSAYLDIKGGEPDPVEYYAYFLGLYINNMFNYKIFTNYKISFPGTYEKKLCNKIMKSFGKGLTKSLPTALLNDEKFDGIKINEVNVNSIDIDSDIRTIIESAAYAITALDKYHFNDKLLNLEDEGIENPECCYAVFDFGAETSDFDFGIYSFIDDDFNDYKIVHFGQGEIPHLGGENLLKYLAFEIFKLNAKRLYNEDIDIKFTRYDGCRDYECVGFENYILRDSKVANSNMFAFMEALRWVWEKPNNKGTQEYEDIKQGMINLDLLDPNGEQYGLVTLICTTEEDNGDVIRVDLQKFLHKKIEAGIESFFNSMVSAFGNYDENYLKDKNEISIFLAGNSSKSVLFNQILAEYLRDDYELPECYRIILDELNEDSSDSESAEDEIEKKLKEKNDKLAYINSIKKKLGNENLKFVVYPPLRTKAGKEKLNEMGYDVDLKDITEPSGKTGVAYGMLIPRIYIEDGLKEKAKEKFNADDIDV